MSRLHYDRVCRARGLPVPLPPKPKARPLGPPVLFFWKDVPIRTRADAIRVSGSWEAFVTETFAIQADMPFQASNLRRLIETLIPPCDELLAHRNDILRRWSERDGAKERRYSRSKLGAFFGKWA